jgi:hypothetical protein
MYLEEICMRTSCKYMSLVCQCGSVAKNANRIEDLWKQEFWSLTMK